MLGMLHIKEEKDPSLACTMNVFSFPLLSRNIFMEEKIIAKCCI